MHVIKHSCQNYCTLLWFSAFSCQQMPFLCKMFRYHEVQCGIQVLWCIPWILFSMLVLICEVCMSCSCIQYVLLTLIVCCLCQGCATRQCIARYLICLSMTVTIAITVPLEAIFKYRKCNKSIFMYALYFLSSKDPFCSVGVFPSKRSKVAYGPVLSVVRSI